jgi:hypothetical protein
MVEGLAAVRRRVGVDLKFLNEKLPSPANLPEAQALLDWHRDLIAAQSKLEGIDGSEPLLRRVMARFGLDGADKVAQRLKERAHRILAMQDEPWVWSLVEWHDSATEQALATLLEFLEEAKALAEERNAFVAKPVSLPSNLPPKPHCEAIFDRLAEGKNPFNLFAFTLKPYRQIIEQIRVAGLPPQDGTAWQHVRSYIDHHARLTSLSARWAALRDELAVPDHVHFSAEQPAPLNMIADRLYLVLVVFPSASEQLFERLASALGSQSEAAAILRHHASTKAFADELSRFVASKRLSAVKENIKTVAEKFHSSTCGLAVSAVQLLEGAVGNPEIDAEKLEQIWTGLRTKLAHLRGLETSFHDLSEGTAILAQAGASIWAGRLTTEPANGENDPLVPADWQAAWDWAANLAYLERIGASNDLSALHRDRLAVEKQLREDFARLVKERTFFNLAATMKGSAKAALNAFAQLIRRIGKGTGKGAALHRHDARKAMENCYDAVPCWIMSSWRVSEQLPATLGSTKHRSRMRVSCPRSCAAKRYLWLVMIGRSAPVPPSFRSPISSACAQTISMIFRFTGRSSRGHRSMTLLASCFPTNS